MSFYQEMQDAGAELIAEFGQPVTIKRKAISGYNPHLGAVTTSTTETQQGIAVLSDMKLVGSGQAYADGSLVEIGDKSITLSAKGLTFVPTTGDTISDVNGAVWKIINVKETNPAGTPVVYNLAGRR
ncbi:hypothetical protein KRX19_05570 [Cardiobacteriaceae bacterium TAE3-ERU3]|nr:hypothetical protein [Cardiobacteriaceae bacterium TAE3-ERU3]